MCSSFDVLKGITIQKPSTKCMRAVDVRDFYVRQTHLGGDVAHRKR